MVDRDVAQWQNTCHTCNEALGSIFSTEKKKRKKRWMEARKEGREECLKERYVYIDFNIIQCVHVS
jgi:hypothetical protein